MADLDPELVERAILWCSEAGRPTTPAHARAALGALKWDELLAARALLADPPPLRPLGPFALADIARGAPADVAAERERAGRYGSAMADAVSVTRSVPSTARGRKKGRAPFVVRRAAEREPSHEPEQRALPLLDELMLEEGRAVLTRLIRRHGGRRARIVESLASGWRRPDAQPPGAADLDRLLSQHGMARAFEIRERDEVLHALRAAGGVRTKACAELGLDSTALDETLDRLGARTDAERLREQRRRELSARATLAQRAHLVLDEGERLEDLGLLDGFVADLRERLPDHVRALGTSAREPLADRLCRSLSLDTRGVERLAHVTGIHFDASAAIGPSSARDERRPPGNRPSSGRPSSGRPSSGRPSSGRSPSGRPPSGRPPSGRPRPGGTAQPARRRPTGSPKPR